MATHARGERDYSDRRHHGRDRHDRRKDDRRDQNNFRSHGNRNSNKQRSRARRNEPYRKYYDHHHNFEAEHYYDDQLNDTKFVDRAYGKMNDGLNDPEIEYVSKELDKKLDAELKRHLDAVLNDTVVEPANSVPRLNGEISVHQTADDIKGTFYTFSYMFDEHV